MWHSRCRIKLYFAETVQKISHFLRSDSIRLVVLSSFVRSSDFGLRTSDSNVGGPQNLKYLGLDFGRQEKACMSGATKLD